MRMIFQNLLNSDIQQSSKSVIDIKTYFFNIIFPIPNCFFLSIPNHLILLAFSTNFLSLIQSIPPSPVVMFNCLKTKIVKSLIVPIFAFYIFPKAWAASSITFTLYFLNFLNFIHITQNSTIMNTNNCFCFCNFFSKSLCIYSLYWGQHLQILFLHLYKAMECQQLYK